MKANREHRVPLCGRAMEILDTAHALVEGTSPFVFPNGVGKQLEDKQRKNAIKQRDSRVVSGPMSATRLELSSSR